MGRRCSWAPCYWEQEYNLEGARSFLVVIASLSVFALMTEPDPSLSPFQARVFAVITILFYAVFFAIQTMRHRAFFAVIHLQKRMIQ